MNVIGRLTEASILVHYLTMKGHDMNESRIIIENAAHLYQDDFVATWIVRLDYDLNEFTIVDPDGEEHRLLEDARGVCLSESNVTFPAMFCDPDEVLRAMADCRATYEALKPSK